MPTLDRFIPPPVLDDRKEADRIAARQHRAAGHVTRADAERMRDWAESLITKIDLEGQNQTPDLYELDGVRPGQAHTMLLEELELMSSECLLRMNQLPEAVLIQHFRTFGVEMLLPAPAKTMLRFTKLDEYLDEELVLPDTVEVATAEQISLGSRPVVKLDSALTIPAGSLSGEVAATSLTLGDVYLRPGLLTQPLVSLAGIDSVTNIEALDGGGAGETIEEAEIRAREEMRQRNPLGTSDDWETHLLLRVLGRRGRVTVFDGYDGTFTSRGPGYVLIAVQGRDGLEVGPSHLASISAVVDARHVLGISVVARPPLFKPFKIKARVRVASGTVGRDVLLAKAKSNLELFFSPLVFRYGPKAVDRFLDLADVVEQVGLASPALISVEQSEGVFAVEFEIDGQPVTTNVPLGLGELPLLTDTELIPV